MKLLKTIRNTLAGIAVAAAFFTLGSVGAVEHNTIPFRQFCLQAVIGMALFGIGVIGGKCIENEIEWRKRRDT